MVPMPLESEREEEGDTTKRSSAATLAMLEAGRNNPTSGCRGAWLNSLAYRASAVVMASCMSLDGLAHDSIACGRLW